MEKFVTYLLNSTSLIFVWEFYSMRKKIEKEFHSMDTWIRALFWIEYSRRINKKGALSPHFISFWQTVFYSQIRRKIKTNTKSCWASYFKKFREKPLKRPFQMSKSNFRFFLQVSSLSFSRNFKTALSQNSRNWKWKRKTKKKTRN